MDRKEREEKMKKVIVMLICIVVCSFAFVGCGCEHVWQEATCETPKTCVNCGEVEGTATGHSWMKANCEQPQICEVCQETKGEALGHVTNGQATCTAGVRCSRCYEMVEEALGHQWQPATLEAPQTCTNCNKTQGEPLTVIDVFPDGKSRHDGTAFLMTYEQLIELFDEYFNRGTIIDFSRLFPILELNNEPNVRSWEILGSEAPGQIIQLTYDPETERVTRIMVKLGEDAIYTSEASTQYLYNAAVIYLVANGTTTMQDFLQNMEDSNVISNGASVSSGCLNGVSYRFEASYHSMILEIWVGEK